MVVAGHVGRCMFTNTQTHDPSAGANVREEACRKFISTYTRFKLRRGNILYLARLDTPRLSRGSDLVGDASRTDIRVLQHVCAPRFRLACTRPALTATILVLVSVVEVTSLMGTKAMVVEMMSMSGGHSSHPQDGCGGGWGSFPVDPSVSRPPRADSARSVGESRAGNPSLRSSELQQWSICPLPSHGACNCHTDCHAHCFTVRRSCWTSLASDQWKDNASRSWSIEESVH